MDPSAASRHSALSYEHAGKSTLNRLELSLTEPSRYHKISHDSDAIESLFVDLFLDAHKSAPAQITLDLDATADPLGM